MTDNAALYIDSVLKEKKLTKIQELIDANNSRLRQLVEKCENSDNEMLSEADSLEATKLIEENEKLIKEGQEISIEIKQMIEYVGGVKND